MAGPTDEVETFNPWSVVNLVFGHLSRQGLHPVLGETGDPGEPAAALLRALGIAPALEGNRQVVRDVREHLATLRTAVLGDGPAGTPPGVAPLSQRETGRPVPVGSAAPSTARPTERTEDE